VRGAGCGVRCAVRRAPGSGCGVRGAGCCRCRCPMRGPLGLRPPAPRPGSLRRDWEDLACAAHQTFPKPGPVDRRAPARTTSPRLGSRRRGRSGSDRPRCGPAPAGNRKTWRAPRAKSSHSLRKPGSVELRGSAGLCTGVRFSVRGGVAPVRSRPGRHPKGAACWV